VVFQLDCLVDFIPDVWICMMEQMEQENFLALCRADMGADGTLIGLGALSFTHLFLRCPGDTIADVLAPPVSANNNIVLRKCNALENHVEGKVESCGFRVDGNVFLQFAPEQAPWPACLWMPCPCP
jgi:hypothetical protein